MYSIVSVTGRGVKCTLSPLARKEGRRVSLTLPLNSEGGRKDAKDHRGLLTSGATLCMTSVKRPEI